MTTPKQSAASTVLVALDGSAAAASAVPTACALADQLGAVVECFEAQAGPPADTAILHAAYPPHVDVVVLTTHGQTADPTRPIGSVAHAVISHTRRPILLVRPELAQHTGRHARPIRHLLLPLDGTPATATALRPVMDLARRMGASIDLLYVVAPDAQATEDAGAIAAPRYLDQPHHEWPAWAERVLEHLAAYLGGRPTDLQIRVFLTVGDIASEITRVALEHHADAIVLVRRSHLEVGRARVLRAVLERAGCPVLLVAAG